MSSIGENKSIVRRFVEAANARDYGALAAIVSPTFERHCPATPDVVVRSFDDFRRFLEQEGETFPDSRVTLDTLVAEGDLVAFWATYSATQSGPFGPFPATGKRFECEFGGIFRIEKQQISRLQLTWDNMGILTKLGHVQPPGSPVSA